MAEVELVDVQSAQENTENTSKSTQNPKRSPAKSRGHLWKDVEVLELLAVMNKETIMLSLDNAKTPKQKRACYNAIHAQLQKKGIKHSLDSVINKWKKLKQQYKTHLDMRKKSGNGWQKKWKFFDGMDQVCGHRDIATPACLIDSSMDSESTGIDEKESDTIDCEPERDLDEKQATVETDENHTETDNDSLDSKYLEEEEKLVQEEKKPDFKICKSKKVKKTKLEKTIELLGECFKTASQKETEVMVQLEETRQKQMLDHEIRLKELDNEKRREERQHELLMLQMLCRNRSQVPPHGEVSFNNSAMYGSPIMNYNPQHEGATNTENVPTYFKL